MLDGGMDQAGDTAFMVFEAVPRGAGPTTSLSARADRETGWRDDFRLFAYAWAAGFVFFMVMLA